MAKARWTYHINNRRLQLACYIVIQIKWMYHQIAMRTVQWT
jgi:hypothetical protein